MSKQALADLADILDYGVVAFGERAAEAYLLGFHAIFELILTHPLAGAVHSVVRPPIRSLSRDSHRISMICLPIASSCNASYIKRWMWSSDFRKGSDQAALSAERLVAFFFQYQAADPRNPTTRVSHHLCRATHHRYPPNIAFLSMTRTYVLRRPLKVPLLYLDP